MIILHPIHFAMSICIPQVPVSSSSVAIREHECHSLVRKTHRKPSRHYLFLLLRSCPSTDLLHGRVGLWNPCPSAIPARVCGQVSFFGEYTSSRDCSLFLVFIWDFCFQQTSGTPFLLGGHSRVCLFLSGPVVHVFLAVHGAVFFLAD